MTFEANLLARRDTAWIDDETGDVMAKVPMPKGRSKTINLTHRFQNAPRRTSNVDILLIEAEILDDTGTVENPARPINPAVKEAALERIDAEGLEPAWRVEAASGSD